MIHVTLTLTGCQALHRALYLSYLSLVTILQDSHYDFHFINEESKVQKLSNLPQIT